MIVAKKACRGICGAGAYPQLPAAVGETGGPSRLLMRPWSKTGGQKGRKSTLEGVILGVMSMGAMSLCPLVKSRIKGNSRIRAQIEGGCKGSRPKP